MNHFKGQCMFGNWIISPMTVISRKTGIHKNEPCK
jgi:hypothetical protein